MLLARQTEVKRQADFVGLTSKHSATRCTKHQDDLLYLDAWIAAVQVRRSLLVNAFQQTQEAWQ